MEDPREWLAAAAVDADVFELRPDYRAVLLTADGLRGGPSDATSERLLADGLLALCPEAVVHRRFLAPPHPGA